MIEVAIMLEGQMGLNWKNLKSVAQTVEDVGFVGLYRSDHFTNSNPPDMDSLELWVSLTWLASHTKTIEFGQLVSPFSFRNPVFIARMAKDIDNLSGGRMTLGLGAGWQEREHEMFGWNLDKRFERFEEGMEVVTRLLKEDGPVRFEGEFYNLNEAHLLPKPERKGGPPILIGGNGENRTLSMAAKYADEWNSIYLLPDRFKELNQILDEKLSDEGRKPESMRRSMMVGIEYGRSDKEVDKLVEARTKGKLNAKELAERSVVVGTANQVVEQLGKLHEAGVQKVMLQWLDLEDMERLESLGSEILPQLKG